MAIVVFQHHPLEHLDHLGHVLTQHGHRLKFVRRFEGDPTPPDLDNVDGLIVMGGPMDTDQQDQHPWMSEEIAYIKSAHDARTPIVGVCLGAQLIAVALGGEVGRMQRAEIGLGDTTMSFFGTVDPLLAGTPWKVPMLHAHGCEVTKAPPGGTPAPLQSTPTTKVQAFKVGMTTYGFQYHFEARRKMLETWYRGMGDWLTQHQYDPAALLNELDSPAYERYRLFSDKLCENIVTLLFPIDKRLAPRVPHAANYHAHVS